MVKSFFDTNQIVARCQCKSFFFQKPKENIRCPERSPFTSWREWDKVGAMEQTQEGLRLRQVLTDYFDKHKEILLARLFGSVAQGRETAKSDVDIAVHGREPLGAEQLVSMQQDLVLLCQIPWLEPLGPFPPKER